MLLCSFSVPRLCTWIKWVQSPHSTKVQVLLSFEGLFLSLRDLQGCWKRSWGVWRKTVLGIAVSQGWSSTPVSRGDAHAGWTGLVVVCTGRFPR